MRNFHKISYIFLLCSVCYLFFAVSNNHRQTLKALEGSFVNDTEEPVYTIDFLPDTDITNLTNSSTQLVINELKSGGYLHDLAIIYFDGDLFGNFGRPDFNFSEVNKGEVRNQFTLQKTTAIENPLIQDGVLYHYFFFISESKSYYDMNLVCFEYDIEGKEIIQKSMYSFEDIMESKDFDSNSPQQIMFDNYNTLLPVIIDLYDKTDLNGKTMLYSF